MKKIKLFAISALSLLNIIGCSNFGDMNVDPNSAVSVPAYTLLSTAQYNFYNALNGTGLNADLGLLMVQQWAQNEYTEDSRYNYDITSFNGTFVSMYTDIAKELVSAKELVAEQDIPDAIKNNKTAIIDVMLVQVFGALTDAFGDVPYSEAISGVTFPKYDAQEDIYKGLLSTLDSSGSRLNVNTNSFDSGELLYNGDVAKWKIFTYSLMLKYAVRILDADPATANTYINKAISAGVMTNNDNNAYFNYPNVDARANPLYRNYSPQIGNRDDYCVSELLVTTLTDIGDPRLDKFAKPTSTGEIIGMPYGLTDNEATELKATTSRPNDAVRDATTPFNVLTHAEVSFLLAEVYQRGISPGNASTAYSNGVTSSMNQWGINDTSAISDYIAANPYDSSDWKSSIGLQKWIALYMNGFEAWNEWRRLDQPSLTPTTNGVINSIPVRIPYPLSETQNNSAQLEKVTTTPGNMTEKVWWDKN
ncbi:SusD/RagB family nutrient-binding outer membrane lipoprotein [Tenacibaculum sp. SG-28]|uniref:SusD/RagB family nutrient-binding outer membrane lipoprotein n=1 Tax=Tenacibaculum sp. SG-28 TaxID=754426 RepID=UPI000D4A867D|nr:SusD/RagB family nutrient-binding outer membrane lipoprotein [Tenacibaculum sp. SG-28]PQJ20825.1 hypothetical protein BSU00_10145 [Tenacibaculum sp. SG-28]